MPPYAHNTKAGLIELCKKYPDSEQAHEIWQEMVYGTGSIQVNALAGVGKTFTSLEGTRPIGDSRSILVLAFNKSIQVEAQGKLEKMFGKQSKTVAKTFNSAGFQAVLAQWPELRPKDNNWDKVVNPDRTWQMLPDNMPTSIKSPVTKLVALCKNTLTNPTRDNLLDLAATYDVDLYDDSGGDFADQVLDLVPNILEQSKTPTDCVDFNDQVWLPVIWQLPVRHYDLVIVDEAQDLNAARKRLAIMLAGPHGRVMYVGDQHQAIYGFSGSMHDSMDSMADDLRANGQVVTVLPLTVTRRCPVLVTALARTIVHDFECLPGAPDGNVCLGTGYLKRAPVEFANSSEQSFYRYETVLYPEEEVVLHNTTEEIGEAHACNEGCITYKEAGKCPNPSPQKGEMILCRVNAPLVQLAYSCIRENKPVKIQGRNIGEGLAKRIKALVPTNATVPQLEEATGLWRTREAAKLEKTFGAGTSRLDDKLQQLEDQVQCILALCEGLNTIQEVLSRITVLFADVEKGNTSNFILLSSVHKAKGLESPVVRIIEPQLLPHPGAHLPWQKEQEQNIKYVAITRSLDTLHIH